MRLSLPQTDFFGLKGRLSKDYVILVLEQLPERCWAWGTKDCGALFRRCVYQEIDQVPDAERCRIGQWLMCPPA
jgi:hypothetical protein